MKIILAPNTFKESLSAPLVAEAMARGVRKVCPSAETVCIPLADGGDGTMEALVAARDGQKVSCSVHDPLMRKTESTYGTIDDGQTAVIEMALASGLWMLNEEERNPLETTTFGTGELMRHAMEQGCRRILIGIGGSATTDGGIGMAAALGYRFLDKQGSELKPVGGSLPRIHTIDTTAVIPELTDTTCIIASDVTNPLTGSDGAAPVFGPQKGATPEMVSLLDDGLANLNHCWSSTFGTSYAETPGAGAAGGLGAGLMAFCKAESRSGFDLVAETASLEDALRGASLVITGEGKIDDQTRFGKVPSGVAILAQKHGVPCVALAGKLSGDLTALIEQGMAALFSITPGPATLEESMHNAASYLEQTTENIIRLWQLQPSKS